MNSKSKSDIIEEIIISNKSKSNGEITDILLKEHAEEFKNWKRKSIRDEVRKTRNKMKNGKTASTSGSENYDFQDGGNKATFTKKYRGEQIINIEQLIKVCGIDTNQWKVDRWICNKWEVGSIYIDQNLKWAKEEVTNKDGDGTAQDRDWETFH